MRFDANKAGLIALSVTSVALVGGLLLNLTERSRVHRAPIAAGSDSGESHALALALKRVVERSYRSIRIEVRITGGTAENLQLLERGEVAFAAAQADVPACAAARMVAILYDDTFQLLVPAESRAARIADLRGRRIALARKGGQFQSFLHVAEHFGLREEDFEFVGDDDQSAARIFLRGDADALFRVRALGNPMIHDIVQNRGVRFVPITQARSMKIRMPALDPSVIPEGTYSGEPAIPEDDVPTVSVQRTLLARRDASEFVVRAVTQILMERRQELAGEIPESQPEIRALLAGVRRPEAQSGLGLAIHEGAQAYYDKDKPAFILEYADFVALLLTVLVLISSWIWELRRWVVRRQKNRADRYNHEVILLITRVQATASAEELETIRLQLLDLLTQVVGALDADRISEEAFQSFRVIWQIALDISRERRQMIGAASTAVEG